MRHARRSASFQRLCLLLALCFVWSFTVAPCAVAAEAAKKSPAPAAHRPARLFTSLADRLANSPYAPPAHPVASAAKDASAPPNPSPAVAMKSVTLLDQVGLMARPVPPAQAAD